MSAYALDKFLNNVFDMYAFPDTVSDFRYTGTEYYQTSNDKEVIIEMPMVGISKEELKIHVEDHVFTIEATPKNKTKFSKSIKKSWTIDDTINIDGILAKLDNGLLIVTLPKVKPLKKTVSVSIT